MLALTLVSAGSVAYASIPDSSGVIHGCRSNLLHTLTVIDSATQSCPIGTTPLNWNQAGIPGAPGQDSSAASFYTSISFTPLGASQTRVTVSAACRTGDEVTGGGYVFGIQDPSGVFGLLDPVVLPGLSVNEAQLVGVGNGDSSVLKYQVDATLSSFVPGPAQTLLEATAVCSTHFGSGPLVNGEPYSPS